MIQDRQLSFNFHQAPEPIGDPPSEPPAPEPPTEPPAPEPPEPGHAAPIA